MIPPISLDPITGLQRLRLANLPTPLESAPRLAAALGLAELMIKREDMSGYALGGNKMRQLDFIVADAIAARADLLVATAASQSNFCRSLAGAAAKLGLGCRLHLRAATGTALVGNLLLNRILGAEISFTSKTDPWDPAITDELAAIAEASENEGRRPFIVQLTGVSAPVAVAGWIAGAAELMQGFGGADPDVMVVVCGSGLSLAGLALGFKHLCCRTRLLGISAQQPEARLKPWIVHVARDAAAHLGLEVVLDPDDFDTLDTQIGPGYGLPSTESLEAVRLAGRTEGLILDPVYTGKGLAGLIAARAAGLVGPADRVVFLHSGGTPGLFAHASAFAVADAT